jgi:hypothetical protein
MCSGRESAAGIVINDDTSIGLALGLGPWTWRLELHLCTPNVPDGGAKYVINHCRFPTRMCRNRVWGTLCHLRCRFYACKHMGPVLLSLFEAISARMTSRLRYLDPRH